MAGGGAGTAVGDAGGWISWLDLPRDERQRLAAFRKGLRDAGFEEGRNVAIEFRWAEAREERMPELVADLIRRGVAVIVAPATTAGALAAKAATTTVPIVFAAGTDPVALGLVTNLSRPGGNVTGVTILGVELTAKRLGLLRELTPQATRFVALVNPRSVMADGIVKNVEASAPIFLDCRSKSSAPAPIANSWRRCRDFRKAPAQHCWLPWMASSSTAAP